MTNLHAATRRELLIASGTLLAWAYLPKLAGAEGRDPRLLVIVLRGARDGPAAIVHAAASPSRVRSHFAGKGAPARGPPTPGAAASGWLNRALASLQPA